MDDDNVDANSTMNMTSPSLSSQYAQHRKAEQQAAIARRPFGRRARAASQRAMRVNATKSHAGLFCTAAYAPFIVNNTGTMAESETEGATTSHRLQTRYRQGYDQVVKKQLRANESRDSGNEYL